MTKTLPTETIQLQGQEGIRCQLDGLHFHVLEGESRGKKSHSVLPLIRIGSDPENDLVLRDRGVSRFHLEVELLEKGGKLRDLGSTNGTRVGGMQIQEGLFDQAVEVQVGPVRLAIRRAPAQKTGFVPRQGRLGPLIGESPKMLELFAILRAIAKTPATVLIQGETGTGKELVAQALHELSGRKGPLVVFDATSSDPTMVRGDLFGHLKGAYTGAEAERPGAFRAAHGGTLFLDEIGELPLDLQPRLLRALESRTVLPLGADRPQPVDVRVVSATHRDLLAMVKEGSFREDLYHRLSVVPLEVPALRERPSDIPLLLSHLSEKLGLRCQFTPEATRALATHPWPGNVRAFRNHLERLSAMHPGQTLRAEQLALPGADPEVLRDAHEDPERALIEKALARCRGNKTQAARVLGMSLSTLKRRIKSLGLDGPGSGEGRP